MSVRDWPSKVNTFLNMAFIFRESALNQFDKSLTKN